MEEIGKIFCKGCGNKYIYTRKNGKLERVCKCCDTRETVRGEDLPQIMVTKIIPAEKIAQIEMPVVVNKEDFSVNERKIDWDLKYDPD